MNKQVSKQKIKNEANQHQIQEKKTSQNKFQKLYNNRLGCLIYHPDFIDEHKQMIYRKMQRIILARKTIEYSGIGLFFLHMLRNKLQLSRSTALFIMVPPILSYSIKILGFMWVDNYAESSGLYKIYKIRQF